MDKDKNLPAPREVSRVDIPPNMTSDDYLGMNIRSGHRIGLEYKQKYLTTLSDLYVEGYLTEEEYDKRATWVNEAQTSEQIEVAFMDLQRSLLQMKVKEYLSATEKRSAYPLPVPIFMWVFVVLVFILGITVESVSHMWWGSGILFAELITLLYFIRRSFKKMM